LCVVAVHARSQAPSSPASHRRTDAVSLGRAGSNRIGGLWSPLLRGCAGCVLRADRSRWASTAYRATRGFHRENSRIRRSPTRSALRGGVMRVYYFTEQPYPDAWNDHQGTLRVTLPNRRLDPVIAADLFHRYYDEWMLADELGLDVMVNEHHQTAT